MSPCPQVPHVPKSPGPLVFPTPHTLHPTPLPKLWTPQSEKNPRNLPFDSPPIAEP
ncbi:MAG: hypothetical protein F6J93_08680 [Oscillatoria sp. SIO1A7]|nr:hypothetical protein [Oscillatoria sp. SIO1A7]